MGNGISCFNIPGSVGGPVKLIFYGGSTKLLSKQQFAGEVMVQFPDCAICPADEFYLGQNIPVLSIEDVLLPGKIYFVIPLHHLPAGNLLTASSLVALLSPGPNKVSLVSSDDLPFEYVKGVDGKTVIKVLPQFITRAISSSSGEDEAKKMSYGGGDQCVDLICSTSELKKHYEQLVSPKNRSWSPKLETISEKKKKKLICEGMCSPVRLLRLEKR